jgi:phosphatidylglycerophosphate synthase
LSAPHVVPDSKKDFQRLTASGEASGVTLSIGRRFARWRDGIAAHLVPLGVTPNALTVTGFVFSLVGSGFLALSAGAALPVDCFAPAGVTRSWLPLVALAWYFLSAACDMLDGAVARVGNLRTEFGGVLDSTLDRISDTAVFCACVVYFAARGNVTYCFLAVVALSNAYMISYIKARAEDIIPDCSVGFWQRGERIFAILVGSLCGHMQILLWQLAILPFLTALRRLTYTAGWLRAERLGRPHPEAGVPSGAGRWLMPWRHPRGSVCFDISVGFNLAIIVFGPVLIRWFYIDVDPLGTVLRRWLAP